LGFVPPGKTGAGLLSRLISQSKERGAALITANPPSEMPKTCSLNGKWTENFG